MYIGTETNGAAIIRVLSLEVMAFNEVHLQ